MDARSAYLKRRHTPTPFSQGPEMKNYSRMMELQSQAPNFAKNDPRFDELKAARRQYNREDKYKIGERFNVAPLDVQKDFSDRTNVFRNEAPNVYRKMYPVSDLAMRYGESGGLLGLAIKGLTGDIGKLGQDVAGAVGIAGAVDDTPEEQADYVGRTFGFYPSDVHPGVDEETIMPKISLEFNGAEGYTAPIEETLLYDENILPYLPPFIDKNTRNEVFAQDVDDLPVNTINNTRTISGLIEPVPLQEDFREQNFEGVAPEPIEPLPFDDSGREAGIAALYGQGPKFGTTNRRYENEYRDFLASQSDTMRQFEPVTYEEFAEAYERMYQGKPQIGFR
jgi:hypothetical protein